MTGWPRGVSNNPPVHASDAMYLLLSCVCRWLWMSRAPSFLAHDNPVCVVKDQRTLLHATKIFTSCISGRGNRIGTICLSVRPCRLTPPHCAPCSLKNHLREVSKAKGLSGKRTVDYKKRGVCQCRHVFISLYLLECGLKE